MVTSDVSIERIHVSLVHNIVANGFESNFANQWNRVEGLAEPLALVPLVRLAHEFASVEYFVTEIEFHGDALSHRFNVGWFRNALLRIAQAAFGPGRFVVVARYIASRHNRKSQIDK